MATLWPWLAIAAVGALHGLNPAGGWVFAAACGVRSRDRAQALRALVPIGGGHAVSVALVAAAVSMGVADYRAWMIGGAVVLLVLALVRRRRTISLAAAAFVASTLHGAGLMLVPAVASMCVAGTPGRELVASGSVVIGIAAVGVHMVAMLAVTAGLAAGGAAVALRRESRPHDRAVRYPSTPAHINTNA